MDPWHEIGDQVYLRRYKSLSLTIGALIGDDAVLLVDTRASHREARELIGDLSQLTDLPVRWVVNTHYHWDHCWGNALFRTAQLWSHEKTRLALLERGEAVRQMVIEHQPVEGHEQIHEVEIVPPDHTFSDQVSLDIGRPVNLRYHGRGHTDSDITVEVGEVIFAGDLVEESAPPAFGDAFPLEWSRTLQEVLGYVTGPVVPGHGQPVDRRFVEQQRADIAATVELARVGFADEVPMGEIDVNHAPFPQDVSRLVVERTYAQLLGQI